MMDGNTSLTVMLTLLGLVFSLVAYIGHGMKQSLDNMGSSLADIKETMHKIKDDLKENIEELDKRLIKLESQCDLTKCKE